MVIIDGTDNDQLVIGANALATQNTFAQISNDKWIGLLQRLVIGKVIKMGFTDSQLCGHLPQLATIALAANNARFRMFGDHQPRDIASMIDDAWGGCLYHHVRGNRGDTGGHQPCGFFILYQAHAASAIRLEIRMVTEMGNFNAVLLCGF